MTRSHGSVDKKRSLETGFRSHVLEDHLRRRSSRCNFERFCRPKRRAVWSPAGHRFVGKLSLGSRLVRAFATSELKTAMSTTHDVSTATPGRARASCTISLRVKNSSTELVEALAPSKAQRSLGVGVNLIFSVSIIDRYRRLPISFIDDRLTNNISGRNWCDLGIGIGCFPFIGSPTKRVSLYPRPRLAAVISSLQV